MSKRKCRIEELGISRHIAYDFEPAKGAPRRLYVPHSSSCRGSDVNYEDKDLYDIDYYDGEDDHDEKEAKAPPPKEDDIHPPNAFLERMHEDLLKDPPSPVNPKENPEYDDALQAGYDSDKEVYESSKPTDAGVNVYDSYNNPIVDSYNRDFYKDSPSISDHALGSNTPTLRKAVLAGFVFGGSNGGETTRTSTGTPARSLGGDDDGQKKPKRISRHMKGTSVLGLSYCDGFIIATDSRSSNEGQKDKPKDWRREVLNGRSKSYNITPKIVGLIVGKAHPCRTMLRDAKKWMLESKTVEVSAVFVYVEDYMKDYIRKGEKFRFSTVIAGYDLKKGFQACKILMEGDEVQIQPIERFGVVGSSEISAEEYMENKYVSASSKEEASELACKTIFRNSFLDRFTDGNLCG